MHESKYIFISYACTTCHNANNVFIYCFTYNISINPSESLVNHTRKRLSMDYFSIEAHHRHRRSRRSRPVGRKWIKVWNTWQMLHSKIEPKIVARNNSDTLVRNNKVAKLLLPRQINCTPKHTQTINNIKHWNSLQGLAYYKNDTSSKAVNWDKIPRYRQ